MLLSLDSNQSPMDDSGFSSDFIDKLRSVCRTTVGDELRSISSFDAAGDVKQVYLRADLERTADLIGFADLERMGFESHTAYQNTQLGEYQGTIRLFENGYLTRVIGNECGVWVTTDTMSMDRFEELIVALKAVIGEYER